MRATYNEKAILRMKAAPSGTLVPFERPLMRRRAWACWSVSP